MRRPVVCLVALAVVAGVAAGQERTPHELAGELAPLPETGRIGITGPPLELGLDEVVARVLESNPQLAVARLKRARARLGLVAAAGAYDPLAGLDLSWTDAVTPVVSSLGGSLDGSLETVDTAAELSLAGLVPRGGGSYSLTFDARRETTDNLFSPLSPQYTDRLTAAFRQPLLRGRSLDATRYALEVAAVDATLSASDLRRALLDVVGLAAGAYWDLAAARAAVEVQRESMAAARRRTEASRRQVEAGLLATADLVASEAEVASYVQGVHAAEAALTRVENLLKTLLLPGRDADVWSRPLVPTEASPAPPSEAPTSELAARLAEAFVHRPELAAQAAAEEIAELGVRFHRDAARPRLDLVASYGLAGLAGTVADRPDVGFPTGGVPEEFVGDHGDAFANLADGDFPTATLAVELGLPLRNRTARAELDQARLDRDIAAFRRAALEQQIESEVRDAVQAVDSARAALDAARAARRWRDEQLASEERRFEAGLSSSFLLFERHRDATEARLAELQAAAALARSRVALDQATGVLLDRHGIRLAGD